MVQITVDQSDFCRSIRMQSVQNECCGAQPSTTGGLLNDIELTSTVGRGYLNGRDLMVILGVVACTDDGESPFLG